MQRIGPITSPADTLAATTVAVEAAPALRAYLAALSRSGRSKLRARLTARGYSPEQVEAIIPRVESGRPANDPTGTFEGLSTPVMSAIADALGVPSIPLGLEAWDDPATASAAADAIMGHYANPTSATVSLTLLRNGLKALGAAEAVWRATLRPGITRFHNQRNEARREERVQEGLSVPDVFRRIADLRGRVEGYLTQGAAFHPAGQSAADLLVALSARPGEAETLTVGERGGVTGVLKKRGVDGTYNLVSALGADVASQFLTLWKAAPLAARTKAMRDLSALVGTWGIQRWDLRAIGAGLSTAAAIAGDAANPVVIEDVRRATLRLAVPNRREAVDHYACFDKSCAVNDPMTQLCASLSEL